jgi:AhpD family alkylhydroperoxidase
MPTEPTPETQKIDPTRLPAEAMSALLGVEAVVRRGGLEPELLHLVKLLASVRNRCAYCVDMHTKDARAHGETEQRLYATPVWRDTPFFTPRERAAFAFAEALTRLDGAGVPAAVFAEARGAFSEPELVTLTLAVVAINMWNRLNAAVHNAAGSYRVPRT